MNPKGSPPANTLVSIITKSDVRYEGTLFNINPTEQTLTLINVKSLGTEGRRPGNEISCSQEIFSSIVFKGNDIKDLQVIEKTEKKEEPKEVPKQSKKASEEFDFSRMNEKFEKLSLPSNDKKDFGTYNKQAGFFDSISNSTVEKETESRANRQNQAKTDMETFGNDYLKNKNTMGRGYYNRGGRGNYRGNNRGRGRGGYHNQGGNHGGGQGGGQGNQGGRGGYRGGRGNRGNNRGGRNDSERVVYVEKK